jgi:hypothetical protein
MVPTAPMLALAVGVGVGGAFLASATAAVALGRGMALRCGADFGPRALITRAVLLLRQWALPNSVQLDPMFVDMMRDLKSVPCLHTSTRSHSAHTHTCRPCYPVSKSPCHALHQGWRSFCTGAAGGAGRTQGNAEAAMANGQSSR